MVADQQPGMIEEFRRRRTKQLVVTVFAVPAIFGLLWLRDNPDQTIAGLQGQAIVIVLLAVVVGMIAFSLGNWRCPKCNGYLGKAINPKFCARRGAQLQ